MSVSPNARISSGRPVGGGRKKSAWNMLVQQVYKAEKSINPNFQFKDALKKASSLKKSGNYGSMMSKSKKMKTRKTRGRRMKGRKTRKVGGSSHYVQPIGSPIETHK